jgi:Rhomboid family
MGAALTGAIYFCSVLFSAFAIFLVHSWHPKIGATVGASGGMFGLVGATLVLSYRDADLIGEASRLRMWLWLVLLIGLALSFLPGISMAGHVGGLLGGALLAGTTAKVRKRTEPSAAATAPRSAERWIPMSKKPKLKWSNKPEEQDYTAAKSYLTLLFDEQTASNDTEALKQAPTIEFQAKDIFRASELPLLGTDNSHVKKDQKRIVAGKKLSPLLLVRARNGGKLIIADGYHRLCAVYGFDENASIPCRLV